MLSVNGWEKADAFSQSAPGPGSANDASGGYSLENAPLALVLERPYGALTAFDPGWLSSALWMTCSIPNLNTYPMRQGDIPAHRQVRKRNSPAV